MYVALAAVADHLLQVQQASFSLYIYIIHHNGTCYYAIFCRCSRQAAIYNFIDYRFASSARYQLDVS